MKCITPMVRYYQEYSLEEKLYMKQNDIKQYNKILPRSYVLDRLDKDENYYTHVQKKNEELKKNGSKYRIGLVPCKKCWACRLNYSAEWATRIMNEVQYHENNYFITLTYDEQHVPKLKEITYKDKDGKEHTIRNKGQFKNTLNPDDIKRFINSIRKHFERLGHKGVKYYLCGEYGQNGTTRPHYHIIFMNLPLNPEKFYDFHQDENLKMHWKTKEVEEIWGKGIIDVAMVEWADAAYVARYGTKLYINNGSVEEYAKSGMVREFVRCSRRPAIGLHFCEDNEFDLLYTDKITMKNFREDTVTVPLPSYYVRKLEEKYPEYIEMLKQDRMTMALRQQKLIKNATTVSDKELAERSAYEYARKGGLLKRENLDREWKDRVKISF